MDKSAVKIVTLSNQRKISFSAFFDSERLKELIVEGRVLYKTIIDLPILPSLASRLEEDLIRKSIFGTAAIEGNPLTEQEVAEIVKSDEQSEGKQKAEKEIINLKNTYKIIDLVRSDRSPYISVDDIKSLHETITTDIKYKHNSPGNYRNYQVKVGDLSHGGIYTPPKIYKDIETLMNEFADWLNSEKIMMLDPMVRAALAHYHLSLIHPFGDGNGRTARALEAYILKLANIKYAPLMLSNYYYRNIDDYYWAFSNTLKAKENDITPFLEFVLKGFIESLNEIKERIVYFIWKFTLRDFYNYLKNGKMINSRQLELLNTLLNMNVSFTLKKLKFETPFNLIFKNVSERTIKRDIDTLLKKELIKSDNDSGYKLNLNVIDHK